jgi:multiple sugar transport system permease protein
VTTTTEPQQVIDEEPADAVTPASSDRESRPGHAGPAWLFMTPFLVLYLLFIIGPSLYMVVMSFFDTGLTTSGLGNFAGFGNFSEALGSSDFWASMWHTIWFTILTTPPLVILAFAFAMLADRARRGRAFFRLAFFLPYILPSAVVALIWIWLYTPALGLISKIVTGLGFAEPNWLGSPNLAMWSLAITTVWWTLGFNFVLYLAGLQDIPRDLYEAAAMDGAGPVRKFLKITLPMLSPVLFFNLLLETIHSFQIFASAFIISGGTGGPAGSTLFYTLYLYQRGFTDFRMGYASAMAWVLVVVVGIITVLFFRSSKAWVHYSGEAK